MRSLSIRVDDSLGRALDEFCQQAGYKKNTVVTRLISAFVRHQKRSKGVRNRKSADPFQEVIGLLHVEPLLTDPDAIDRAVYS